MISLRDARISAGKRKKGSAYTQQEVADALEISRRTLSRWEHDEEQVSRMSFYALAYYYNVEVESFRFFSHLN